jgi:hypothetical protein
MRSLKEISLLLRYIFSEIQFEDYYDEETYIPKDDKIYIDEDAIKHGFCYNQNTPYIPYRKELWE